MDAAATRMHDLQAECSFILRLLSWLTALRQTAGVDFTEEICS
jgi:hypothetical protein